MIPEKEEQRANLDRYILRIIFPFPFDLNHSS
jgi:hypothetical protein